MNFLAQWLEIPVAEGERLTGLRFGFYGAPSGAALVGVIALALVLVACAVLLYWRERARLGWLPRLGLAAVRATLLGFLLLLLLQPYILGQIEGDHRRPIYVLLDDSRSMTQVDRRTAREDRLRQAIATGHVAPDIKLHEALLPKELDKKWTDLPRIEVVKRVLTNAKLDLIAGLRQKGPVQFFLFGEKLRTPAVTEDESDPLREVLQDLTGMQAKTALGDAIYALVSKKGNERPAAIVVMTDGRNNAGGVYLVDAAQACREGGVPLHIYGVGSTRGGTLRLVDVLAQDTIFYDDIAPVRVRWQALGIRKGTLRIQVELAGKRVAEKEIPVEEGYDLRETLTFVPRKNWNLGKDSVDLVVSVQVKESDRWRDSAKRKVRLSDRKVRVLYIEATPRWEFKFLQSLLVRDRRVEARFILTEGDPRLMKHEPFLLDFPKREDFFKFDLVILGDVPLAWLNKERRELLREYVRDFRGGLVCIAGASSFPWEWAGSDIEELLPVEVPAVKFIADESQRPIPYRPVLTAEGERTPMLSFADDLKENRRIWSGLPPFYWHYPVKRLRPGAVALLVHPHKKSEKQPMPILARHFYGKGEVLFLATDETWRWRYNVEDKYYARFWGQLIYQMAQPHLLGNASQRAVFAIGRSEAILDRGGYLYLRLLDKEYRPLAESEVPATIEYLDAPAGARRTQRVVFRAIPGRPGEYRLFRTHARPGRFRVHVSLPKHQIDSDFRYVVKLPPRHEMEQSGLAEAELRELAQGAGGRFYREENLASLAESIEPKVITTVDMREGNWLPLAFGIFVTLISIEWLGRKLANLT